MILKDKGKTFTPAPEGLHQAVCVDVVELEPEEGTWKGKPTGIKEKLRIVWQINEVMPTTGKRFIVGRKFTASLSEKAMLRKILDSWRGRKFTKEELAGFDMETIIGANGMVNVVHNVVDDGTVYANVDTVVPLVKGMQKMQPEDYIRVRDRSGETSNVDSHGDDDTPPF